MWQWKRRIWWGYLAFLHAIVLMACWKTDLLPRFGRRMGMLPPLPPTPAQHSFYQRMRSYHAAMDAHVPDGSVLFLGDSHVQGLCVTALTSNAVNFGIAGDTTAGLLDRLPHYPSLSRCRMVVLAIGVNDFDSFTNAEVLKNYRRLLEMVPVPIIVSAILPIDEREHPPLTGYNARIRDFNRDLAELCRERPQCKLINAGAQLMDAEGQLAPANHVGDGVHLSPAGYAIWIAALRTAFE